VDKCIADGWVGPRSLLFRVAVLGIAVHLAALSSHAGDMLFAENFDSLTPGDVHNQNAWVSEPTTNAQIQSAIKFAGAQAASIGSNGWIRQEFNDATATNVWVDFRAYVDWPASAAVPYLDTLDGGGFYVGSNGVVHVWSNTTWVSTSTTVPENVWRRFTVNIDYASSNWALYVASDVPNALSAPVATGLPFNPSATNDHLTRLTFEN
jgi:hypothetical protein